MKDTAVIARRRTEADDAAISNGFSRAENASKAIL